MEINGVQNVIEKMNQWGYESKPFVFAFDFELKQAFIIDNPLLQNEVLFRTPESNNFSKADNRKKNNPKKLQVIDFIDIHDYETKFRKVHNAIKHGDSYLCNLTVKTRISLNISLTELLLQSWSYYGINYKNQFVSFSPERFVYIKDRTILSNPMKGTIDSISEEAYLQLANDYKEDCEHNTIVDLIRNDLGMVASNISVRRFKYIEPLYTDRGHLLQMSSEIEGTLPENYQSQLGNIIFTLLPAGSVSGAPKQSTLKIIRESEGENRGYYTGVFGYFNGKSLDSAVMIRFIENDYGRFYYRSGGGITINSQCKSEWQESMNKIYIASSPCF
ncbi:MAG TPA: aminodeoxychorismate synthase component I [Bacteroidales bacterium]|nr:aminodeoxychorismate synthase component I [Bacteroidales bacterium]HQP03654.1 aminodeoxychorismate synthase component I [Bacteroidales bacterium]